MASRKFVLVTGANSGIGYEAVKALLESDREYHVFLSSRSLENAKTAVETVRKACPDCTNTVEPLQLDVTSDESIQKAYEHIRAGPGHLDTLINNAGATFDIEFLRGTVSLRECFDRAYSVNVTGAHVTTWTMVPLLLKASDPRLIFVGGLSQITKAAEKYFPTPDLPAGWPKQLEFDTIGYRCSKTALNMLMLDWNHKLKADGVKVWCVGPGMLVTNLGRVPELAKKMGAQPASLGGEVLRKVVEGERDADVGQFVHKGGFAAW